jgi:hypothetical protein
MTFQSSLLLGIAIILAANPAAADSSACTAVTSENAVLPGGVATDNVLAHVTTGNNGQAWAVGYSLGPDGYLQTLVEESNGGAWKIVPSPNFGAYHNQLLGVWIADANDVWATGSFTQPTYLPSNGPCTDDSQCPLFGQAPNLCVNGLCQQWYALIEHFDGTSWSIDPYTNNQVVSPPAWAAYGYPTLFGVSGTAPNDVWAGTAFVLHWDGNAWSPRETGIPADGGHGCWTDLIFPGSDCAYEFAPYAFGINGPNDIWGSGEALMHWDGSAWSKTALPPASPNDPGCGAAVTWFTYFNGGTGQPLVNNDGSGYTSVPSLIVEPSPLGSSFTAQAVAEMGVNNINVTRAGSGYTSVPTVTIPPPSPTPPSPPLQQAGPSPQAIAVAYMGVNSVSVISGGSGYTSAPSVVFDPSPTGDTATGVATVRKGAVSRVTLTHPGSGYTALPNVALVGGGGSGAQSAVNDLNVQMVSAGFGPITFPGWGYTSRPTVSFSGGGGSGAAATVQDLQLLWTYVTNGGDGYNGGNTVYSITVAGGGGSGATAYAMSACSDSGTIGLKRLAVDGGFAEYAAGEYDYNPPNAACALSSYIIQKPAGSNTWSAMAQSPGAIRPAAVEDISLSSPTDGWAVGQSGPNDPTGSCNFVSSTPFVEHWNGSSWNVVPESGSGNFNSVATTGAGSAWAVGFSNGSVQRGFGNKIGVAHRKQPTVALQTLVQRCQSGP